MSFRGRWPEQVAARCRALRLRLGVGLARAGGGDANKHTLARIEGQEADHLYLDQIVVLARRLDVPMAALLRPWPQRRHPAGTFDADPTARTQARLRAAIEHIGLRPLARAAGMDHAALTRAAGGECRLDLARIEAIAAVLGEDPADLVLETACPQT